MYRVLHEILVYPEYVISVCVLLCTLFNNHCLSKQYNGKQFLIMRNLQAVNEWRKSRPTSKLIALKYVLKLIYLIFWYSNMYGKSVKDTRN